MSESSDGKIRAGRSVRGCFLVDAIRVIKAFILFVYTEGVVCTILLWQGSRFSHLYDD